jgi:hypothetical protein
MRGAPSLDLWTAVDRIARLVLLEIDYALKPVPLELSRLAAIFDPRPAPRGEVHIVTTEESDAAATLAGIVVAPALHAASTTAK